MKKERLEDLGRIFVMLDQLLEDDTWELYNQRPKDFEDWFFSQSIERQRDIVHELGYFIQDTNFNLHEILSIARGDL